VAEIKAAIGPNIRKANTENSSAGSKRKNGSIGKNGWILAGMIISEIAARLPKIAAPVRPTLRFANNPSAI
jgi:hypothetical protein